MMSSAEVPESVTVQTTVSHPQVWFSFLMHMMSNCTWAPIKVQNMSRRNASDGLTTMRATIQTKPEPLCLYGDIK